MPKVNIDINNIENNSLFSEKIIGDQSSPVVTLINELKNSDWVKKGLEYLPKGDSEQCPFCQEKTITQQIATNIKNFFDETYDRKIEQIKELQELYNIIQLPEITQYENNDFVKKDIDKFINLYNKSKQIIKDNKREIENKLNNPSEIIKLSNTKESINSLNNFIADVNNKITEYNKKIDNKERTKENIKTNFWQIMRLDYDAKIEQYFEDKKRLESDIKSIEDKITQCSKDIDTQKEHISAQQEKTINIDEAIDNINTGLNDLGIEGFCIKKYENKLL